MSRQLHRSVIKEQLAPFWVDMCHLLSRCCLLQRLHFLVVQRQHGKLKISFLSPPAPRKNWWPKTRKANQPSWVSLTTRNFCDEWCENLFTLLLHLCSHISFLGFFVSDSTVNNEGIFLFFLFQHSIANISAFSLFRTDNSISVLAKHDAFRRQKQEMYFLPIIVTDNGNPPMSSTNTLTIRVCGCSKDGIVQSCNVEAYVLPIGLSMGALIAILACIILLLGEHPSTPLIRIEYNAFISPLLITLRKFAGLHWQYSEKDIK